MTDILSGLEDLNAVPRTPHARRLLAALVKAGFLCLDIRDDGARVIALAEYDATDHWAAWIGFSHDWIDTRDLVAEIWDWREMLMGNRPIQLKAE